MLHAASPRPRFGRTLRPTVLARGLAWRLAWAAGLSAAVWLLVLWALG